MSPKPEGSVEVAQPERRWMSRSLARAGLQLGQVMTGALANRLDAMEERLNTGPSAKSGGAAHGRMRELLDQDRAMVAGQEHVVRVDRGAQREVVGQSKRGNSSSAAQGRMRDLLRQDRQLLAGQHDDDDDFEREARAYVSAPAAARSSRETLPKGVIAPLGASQPSAAEAVAAVPAPEPVAAVVPVAEAPAKPTSSLLAEAQALVAVVRAQTAAAAAAEEDAALPSAKPAPIPPPTAAAPAAPPAAAAPAAPQAAAPAGDGPIRTRTMARLFALQGYNDRALSIYDELLAVDPNDASLRAEADRLRSLS